MSTLTLLRHGQAAFGADHYDCLSADGERQAQAVGDYLSRAQRRFDRVMVGPRERHRLTALHALSALGGAPEGPFEAALDEFAEGQQILAAAQQRQGVQLLGAGAVTGKDAARCYMREIEAWAEGHARIPGVVDAPDFRRRVGRWRDRVTAECGPGTQLLAVTSGGVIAALLADALNLPDMGMAQLMAVIYNASITELTFSQGRPASLLSFNQNSFLPPDLLTRI